MLTLVISSAVVIAGAVGYAGSAHSAVYHCTGSNGDTIYTDNPTQLSQCTTMELSPEPSRQAGPIPTPLEQPVFDPPPTPVPAPPPQPVQDLPPHSLITPPTPHAGSTDPSSVRCQPGLNPLNPLTVTCTRDRSSNHTDLPPQISPALPSEHDSERLSRPAW